MKKVLTAICLAVLFVGLGLAGTRKHKRMGSPTSSKTTPKTTIYGGMVGIQEIRKEFHLKSVALCFRNNSNYKIEKVHVSMPIFKDFPKYFVAKIKPGNWQLYRVELHCSKGKLQRNPTMAGDPSSGAGASPYIMTSENSTLTSPEFFNIPVTTVGKNANYIGDFDFTGTTPNGLKFKYANTFDETTQAMKEELVKMPKKNDGMLISEFEYSGDLLLKWGSYEI